MISICPILSAIIQDLNLADPLHVSQYQDHIPNQRRQSERLQTENIACQIGEIVDLSTTGMCVRCKGKPSLQQNQMGRLKLNTNDVTLNVSGRVRWIKKKGFRSYEIGFQFLDVKKGVAEALQSLAEFGFLADDSVIAAAIGKKRRSSANATFDIPDFYRVLGVKADASETDIHRAYRDLARKYHPDVAQDDPDSQQKFIQITQAYETLKDAKQRALFDLRTAI